MTIETAEEPMEGYDDLDLAHPIDIGSPAARWDRQRVIDWGMAVVAAVVLAAGLWTWAEARGHDAAEVERAELRDAVLIAAVGHIETLNSLDHREVDEGLARWEGATTGVLHDQIAATTEEERQLLADQQMISVGHVVDGGAGVVELTEETAMVVAVVEVTVQDDSSPDAAPTVKRNRFAADLVEVDGRWLLESLTQVAVNAR